jgi:NAD+ kinase
MRAFVFSFLPKKDVKAIKKILLKKGFIVSAYKPDFIVSFGGDGTFLSSERNYPGVPKIFLRDNGEKTKYIDVDLKEFERVLEKVKKGLYKVLEFYKVEAIYNSKKLVGLNEVQIRNRLPIEALRFDLKVNGKTLENVIADGVVVSTPLGSTGYFSSIGGKKFKKGLGICLNNPNYPREKKKKCMIVDDTKKIYVKINYGDAYLAADNNRNVINLKAGDEVTIRKSEEKAKVIVVK